VAKLGCCRVEPFGATVASVAEARDDRGMAWSVRSRALFVAWWLGCHSSAQTPPQLTLATVLDRGEALLAPPPSVHWLPEGGGATVLQTDSAGNQTLHRVVDGQVEATPIADAIALRALLGTAAESGGGSDDPATFPPLRWLDAKTLRLEWPTAVCHWQPDTKELQRVLDWPTLSTEPGDEAPAYRVAPNDTACIYRHQHQLWLVQRDGKRRQLTFDGGPDIVYGGAAHRAEFGIRRGLFWSDDGRFLCFYREDQRGIAPYPYLDLAATPPAPRAGRYPMAGRTHAKVSVGVFDTAAAGLRWLEADPDEDVYWTNVTPGPGPLVHVARVARSQDRLELVRYDALTGKKIATLLHEQDPEWVEPEHGPTFLADGRFLWWSTRSGHRHLWLYERDGSASTQLTKGAFDVQRLLGLCHDGSGVWYQASGEDPRQLHLFAACFDGSDGKQITRERGNHRAELSPDRRHAAVVWSNLETAPQVRLLDLASGKAVPLPSPPQPLPDEVRPKQRLFQLKAADDSVLYGHLLLPPDLQEGQRCPVLLYVYGGPQVQLVTDTWRGGAPLWLEAFAAAGYVVCRVDNRGTPNRGIEFEQAVHRRLGQLEVDDQLAAVAWLAQQPFVDPERIGVHGWSFGGYLTLRLLLAAPTTFACGVSGAPVTDWAMYETGYTERYLDTPAENPEGYERGSCLANVAALARPLLLVHGTDDRTVMLSHSLAFVDRCIAAGKQIDYFPYPMQLHGLRGQSRKHFVQLLHDWLGRHLRPHERKQAPPAATSPKENADPKASDDQQPDGQNPDNKKPDKKKGEEKKGDEKQENRGAKR
jgi:dipeptidyl-peptidase 4